MDYPTYPCASCKAEMIWALTATGARIPLDAKPGSEGSFELLREFPVPRALHVPKAARAGRSDLYMPHHATCPQGKQWQRKKS